MVDKPKNNAPGVRQQVRRAAQTSGSRTNSSSTSDQGGGDTKGTRSYQIPDDEVTHDLEVLEKRVLGAVRGAVTDVLKESNQHPELPYIDMDFTATDGAAKISRPATSSETLAQSQYSDRSDTSITPPEIDKEPTISLLKLGSTIMAGLITGLVIGVVFGIIPLPINNFSDAEKVSNDNTIDGAVDHPQNNSQSFGTLTDNTTLSSEPPKMTQAQRSYLNPSDPSIAAPSVKPELQGGIANPSALSISKRSVQQQNIKADEKPKTATAAPILVNENNGTAQLPTSSATEIKVRRPLKDTPDAKNAAKETAKVISPAARKKSAPIGQVIKLRIKGGTIEITGRLKEYDDTNYVIALAGSRILTLRADLYDCVSDNCKKITN